MLKEGGVVLITCASTGRIEHGTDRSSPESSPGTQSVSWSYYKNLTARDFKKEFNFEQMFTKFSFFYNSSSKDLYFIGRKIGSGGLDWEEELFRAQVGRINEMVRPKKNIFRRFLGDCVSVPLDVANTFLPEGLYQNFGLFYNRHSPAAIGFFKRLLRINSERDS